MAGERIDPADPAPEWWKQYQAERRRTLVLLYLFTGGAIGTVLAAAAIW